MKKFIILLIIVIIGLVVWFFVFKQPADTSSEEKGITTPTTQNTFVDDGTRTRYTNDKYGFSFEYPASFVVSDFEDGGAQSIVIQEEGGGAGFQIEVTPIDENIENLTVERIRQDLPDILIKSPQEVVLGERGKGVVFESNDPSFEGGSREIWFVYNKYLYQIRTYVKYDDMMKSVLNSWIFN